MIGTLISKEPKVDKNENIFFNVKTDIPAEGSQYAVSFNAFNSEYNKHADIVREIPDGSRIEIEAENKEFTKKDGTKGKGWELKSIKLAGVQEPPAEAPKAVQPPVEAPKQAAEFVDVTVSREDRKQIFIGWQHTFGKWIDTFDVLDEVLYRDMAAHAYAVASDAYYGKLKTSDGNIPF